MRLNTLLKLVYIAGVTVFATSCTERIEIDLDESERRIVVDGQITTDTMAHAIRLTTSTNFFYAEQPPSVTGASVYLDSGTDKILLQENPSGSGIYLTPDNYFGIPGNSYKLEINLDEKVGESDFYIAESQMAETFLQIDSIALEYQDAFEIWFVKMYAYDPPTKDFYKIDIMRNDLMTSDTASRAQVTDDRFFNGNNTNGLTVTILRKDEVAVGDTITLVLSAINEEYYNFFLQLQTESGPANPLFSGPPANVISNVKEGGLGFFTALSRKKSILIVKPEMIQP